MEAILGGGEAASTVLVNLLARTQANAHIAVREEIAAEMNPSLQAIHQQMTPLAQNFQATNEAMVESMFRQARPDLDPHIETARKVATALRDQYPAEVAQMQPQQFVEQVATQTEQHVLTQIKATAPWFNGTLAQWAEVVAKMNPEPPATPPADATPPATPPAAAAPATPPAAAPAEPPATPPATKPKLPAANAPAGHPNLMATHPDSRGQKGWHKSVAASLVD
jgi:hypothetical protein